MPPDATVATANDVRSHTTRLDRDDRSFANLSTLYARKRASPGGADRYQLPRDGSKLHDATNLKLRSTTTTTIIRGQQWRSKKKPAKEERLANLLHQISVWRLLALPLEWR